MISKVENNINSVLTKFPIIKKSIKRIYQLAMYAGSPKIKYEGDVKRISPKDGMEYFFGYYDKSPWDATDRYILSIRANNTVSSVAPKEAAEIVMFDTHNNNTMTVLGETTAWNIQQGCMLQWLGPSFNEKIIYNDFRNGNFCSVILNVKTKEEKLIEKPIYSLDQEGRYALSLDFSRVHRLRKGYGYSNLPDNTAAEKCPNTPCIWKIDLKEKKVQPLLTYKDFANFEPREDMIDAEHKINHIMISPSGKRFMVLHRWLKNSNKFTRLVTVSMKGEEMYNLNDANMTSHCTWKNDEEILAFANRKDSGNGYYLFKDKTNKVKKVLRELTSDGHPSYSPDNEKLITDTYPDRRRLSKLYYIEGNRINRIARLYSPFKYDNDKRCDLHPRWNRKGDTICIDSVFEGKRGLYIIDVKGEKNYENYE